MIEGLGNGVASREWRDVGLCGLSCSVLFGCFTVLPNVFSLLFVSLYINLLFNVIVVVVGVEVEFGLWWRTRRRIGSQL